MYSFKLEFYTYKYSETFLKLNFKLKINGVIQKNKNYNDKQQ